MKNAEGYKFMKANPQPAASPYQPSQPLDSVQNSQRKTSGFDNNP